MFILISLPNVTVVWPLDRKNDFLRSMHTNFCALFLKPLLTKTSRFEREGLFHLNHDPRFSVSHVPSIVGGMYFERELAKVSILFCFLMNYRGKILGVPFNIAIEE